MGSPLLTEIEGNVSLGGALVAEVSATTALVAAVEVRLGSRFLYRDAATDVAREIRPSRPVQGLREAACSFVRNGVSGRRRRQRQRVLLLGDAGEGRQGCQILFETLESVLVGVREALGGLAKVEDAVIRIRVL